MTQVGNGEQLIAALKHAAAEADDRLSVYNLYSLMVGFARRNEKRPAYISFAINDDAVKNIKGDEKLRDLYLVVRIPRDVVDAMTGEPQTAPAEEKEPVEV